MLDHGPAFHTVQQSNTGVEFTAQRTHSSARQVSNQKTSGFIYRMPGKGDNMELRNGKGFDPVEQWEVDCPT